MKEDKGKKKERVKTRCAFDDLIECRSKFGVYKKHKPMNLGEFLTTVEGLPADSEAFQADNLKDPGHMVVHFDQHVWVPKNLFDAGRF